MRHETCEDGSSRLLAVLAVPCWELQSFGSVGSHLPPASIAAEGVRLGVMEELEESLDQSQVSEDSVIGMTEFGEQMLQLSDPSHYRVDERTAGSGLAFLAMRARDDQPVGNAPLLRRLSFGCRGSLERPKWDPNGLLGQDWLLCTRA